VFTGLLSPVPLTQFCRHRDKQLNRQIIDVTVSERVDDADDYTGYLVVRLRLNRTSRQPCCAFTLVDLSRTAVEQLDESKNKNVHIVASHFYSIQQKLQQIKRKKSFYFS
jgi:hypothetical protein